MDGDTAGDLGGTLNWTRRTTAKLARQLRESGIRVGTRTVARLLRSMGYSLRVNHKKLAAANHPQRDAQFARITVLRRRGASENIPIISIDTKKKELIGRFKNAGAKWDRYPEQVHDHDFRSLASGVAVPYGIYDLRANTGTVFVGTSSDTPVFAADCVAAWWRDHGKLAYPDAGRMIIFADSGGSNGCRPRAWKAALQHKLCDQQRIEATVAHYPAGTSKWNPIEHRLFSEISKNWAGVPLIDLETILAYIRSTTTRAGLRVSAYLNDTQYQKGIKITDQEMQRLNISSDDQIPRWNYTKKPR